MPVWDLEQKFTGRQIGLALSRLWEVQGPCLVPAVDVKGNLAHCPITLQHFDEPVLLSDGFVYDRDSALTWLDKHDTSPCTNETLRHKIAFRLEPLREALEYLLDLSKSNDCEAQLQSTVFACQEFLTKPVTRQTTKKFAELKEYIDVAAGKLQNTLGLLQHAEQVLGDILEKVQRAAVLDVQRLCRGFLGRKYVRVFQLVKKKASQCIKSHCRSFISKRMLAHEHLNASKAVVNIVIGRSLRRANGNATWELRRMQLSAHLWSACETGSTRLVDLFIKKGADINACFSRRYGDTHEGTPLMISAASGHVSVVQVLCESRANLQQRAEIGHIAGQECYGNDHYALCLAAERGHLEVTRVLVQAYADLNVEALYGTPLNIAVHEGCFSVAQYLCQSQACVYSGEEPASCSPLHTAAGKGDSDSLQLLMQFRAAVDCLEEADGECWTALERAAEQGHLSIIRMLLESGADIRLNSPLHMAAESAEFQAVALLLSLQADVNSSTPHGIPICCALPYDYEDLDTKLPHLRTMLVLLSAGADVAPVWEELENGRSYDRDTRKLLALWDTCKLVASFASPKSFLLCRLIFQVMFKFDFGLL